ncbi:hypothetical protein E2C01_085630 [Portunus trituberculatus]|uniref:Uncharacterized protein n=1 Tax=Portunus trituberculatus TaxID=210409 RepID=A0A5B7J838_PORTR|nr:hypothetical protein [Portunus trituberculatus]
MYCVSRKADAALLRTVKMSFIETVESDGLDGGQDVASIVGVLIDRSPDRAKCSPQQSQTSCPAPGPPHRRGLTV